MQLRPITFQNDGPSDEPFSKHYSDFMESECAAAAQPVPPAIEAQQVELVRRMRNLPIVTSKLKAEVRASRLEGIASLRAHFEHILELLRLLESDQAGPPQWLCTSHYDVVFYPQDYHKYTDTDVDGNQLTVRSANDENGKRKFVLSQGEGETEIYEPREAAETVVRMLSL